MCIIVKTWVAYNCKIPIPEVKDSTDLYNYNLTINVCITYVEKTKNISYYFLLIYCMANRHEKIT